ncbi:hypothetical protein AB6A40_010472 [Gnathostoma spinigerum]|uniref:Uncharacterized protein n=1 Tax=Gnathostoma spinigerum TaxID=75299 RepID=A0ABD6EVD4_9BILA
MESYNKEVSSTGTVSRVDVKFAYLANDKLGSVFVPPRAVFPTICATPNLQTVLKAGDVVHFSAVPQKDKNGCSWLATKVQISSNNELYQMPVKANIDKYQQIRVETVTETFAYASSPQLGGVFVPGAAFPSSIVTRLDTYLKPGDNLIASIRSQAPRNNCAWIAETAAKVTSLSHPDRQSSFLENQLTNLTVAASPLEITGTLANM